MQVKKFEAKTMQEALNMVKRQLGPEAIILAAKDNTKGFGLGGESSVEVTAAVSGQKLREHEYAMSRLRDLEKEKVLNSSASMQKKFVEKSVNRFREEDKPRRNLARYASIMDEEEETSVYIPDSRPKATVSTAKKPTYAQQGNIARMKNLLSGSAKSKNTEESTISESFSGTPVTSTERVKQATQSALKAFSQDWGEEEKAKAGNLLTTEPQKSSQQVKQLQDQIAQLQKVIANFKDIPQSFIGSYPGAKYEIPFELSPSFERLMKKGFDEKNTAQLILKAKKSIEPGKWEKRALVEAFLARSIMERVKINPGLENALHVFVGPSGSGKTSALIKCASRMVVHERKKVAIITTDTYKLGASEQLRIYARILNVPFAIVRGQKDWEQVLSELQDMDSILVDTPGLSLKNIEEMDWVKKALPETNLVKPKVHYVQSVSAKNIDAKEIFSKFNLFGIDDIIFSKLDESAQHGLIYNLSVDSNVPVLAFCTGPNVPEDFEFASVERIVDLIFDLSKAGK